MRRRSWQLGLALITALSLMLLGHGNGFDPLPPIAAVQAQSPPTAPAPASPTPPAPITLPSATPAPAPSPPAGASPPSPPTVPLPTPTGLPTPALPPALPPATTAQPLPLTANPYTDPAGLFRVGVLQGYTANPLAGAVLVEAPDGSLAYTVVPQTQPNAASGLPSGFNTEALTQAAIAVFQRGEGFQAGAAQPEAGGGIVLDWTGSLTISGRTQPVSGKVLVRPTPRAILLLLIAATEAGKDRVSGALASLANTLQPL